MDSFDARFASKMQQAGLSPQARIGIAVSGGADSTALCVLASRWIDYQKGGALMAFIVDHGLRHESSSEALLVVDRVSKLGIKCEVLKCVWPDGLPSKGHLQEAARNARYEQLQLACKRNNVGVLLTAHHADDQVELFVIRLSRHSGLAGLAGMPLESDMFRCMPESNVKDVIVRTHLVRPLLDFRKSDLLQVCAKHKQPWVEDPTNKNLVFLRNMVRKTLGEPEFSFLRTELTHVIKLCRRLRTLSDRERDAFLRENVFIDEDLGYAVLNLEMVNLNKVTTLSRAIVALMQFVAQKDKPPRGKVVQRLVRYIKHRDLKNQGALTVAGCNICMVPGSKGSSILISPSYDSKAPVSAEPVNLIWPYHQMNGILGGLAEMSQKHLKGDVTVEMDGDLIDRLIDKNDPDQILFEAKKEGIISDKCITSLSTIVENLSMRPLEHKLARIRFGSGCMQENVDPSACPKIPCGHTCYFMNRFLIAWGKKNNQVDADGTKCSLFQEMNSLWVRFMEEKDWTFLFRHTVNVPCGVSMSQCCGSSASILPCCTTASSFALNSQALLRLKRIPLVVRRTLPVLVSVEGALIGIPALQLSLCPKIWISSTFSPRVPLGGGTTSWK